MPRKHETSFFEEFPNASRAAEGFAEGYKERRATGTVTELKTVDTGKKFYVVFLEWDEHAKKGRKGKPVIGGRGIEGSGPAGGSKGPEADAGGSGSVQCKGTPGSAPKPEGKGKPAGKKHRAAARAAKGR